jgi:hypothetical protein
VELNNVDQAGASEPNGLFGIFGAPMCIEFGNHSRFGVNLNCENLRELLGTEWASRHREALEDAISIFPFLLIDGPEYAFVCLVQSLGIFSQSASNALEGCVTQRF